MVEAAKVDFETLVYVIVKDGSPLVEMSLLELVSVERGCVLLVWVLELNKEAVCSLLVKAVNAKVESNADAVELTEL